MVHCCQYGTYHLLTGSSLFSIWVRSSLSQDKIKWLDCSVPSFAGAAKKYLWSTIGILIYIINKESCYYN